MKSASGTISRNPKRLRTLKADSETLKAGRSEKMVVVTGRQTTILYGKPYYLLYGSLVFFSEILKPGACHSFLVY
jgi:hypothetical protein